VTTLVRGWSARLAVTALVLAGCSLAPRAASDTRSDTRSDLALAAASDPLPIGTGWGPTAEEIDHARALVAALTVRERAGQVIVASYTGTSPPTALVNELHLGGIVSFASNIVDPAQVRAANQQLQTAAADAGRPFPVVSAVDQEGGRVARLTTGATRFPTFMTSGAARDTALTQRAYAALGGELASVGYTVDFAPDADVTRGPSDPTIGARSAGSTPSRVGRQGDAARRGIASSGLVAVLKHFPGHGSVTTDSHLGLPVQRKSLAQLQATDLVPFKTGITAGASTIMVGHLDVRAVDPGVPSSLSRKVVTGLLRGTLGFQGLAVTDSLQMGAVVEAYGVAGAAVAALKAGEDVLLMPGSPRVAVDGIVDAVRSGRLSERRLDQAATRMVALLLHKRAHGLRPVTPGSSTTVSRQLSAAGLTVVKGPCSGRVVGARVHVTGPAEAVARFGTAARDAGLATGSTGTTVRLIGYHGDSRDGDVVVAMDTPYVLGAARGRLAKVATYGDTGGAMRALVSVLLGRTRAPGTLPVAVSGVPRTGC
jgi:beta-N-acetylhexosaminidase